MSFSVRIGKTHHEFMTTAEILTRYGWKGLARALFNSLLLCGAIFGLFEAGAWIWRHL